MAKLTNRIEITIIGHNIRSAHNIGSLLRTADGIGANVFLTGYSPYPISPKDSRLPHVALKTDRQIAKTALGAQHAVNWKHEVDVAKVLTSLKKAGYIVAALEQSKNSIALPRYNPPPKIAVVLGREVEGLETEVLNMCDVTLEIPMSGQKESFNVVVAAAMAAYHLRFANTNKNY